MDIAISQRFRSGQCCPESGWYIFDGYADGTLEPFPGTSELEISLEGGDVFPPIRNVEKGCYWRREVAACDEGLFGGSVPLGLFPMEVRHRN
jgi:hypothetical protein